MAGVFDNHNWAWAVVGIRGSLYNCLHCLVNESGGTGLIEKLSERLISERCNVAKESARQHLRELEKIGFIKREPRTTVSNVRVTNAFRLNRHQLFPKASADYPGAKIGDEIWKSLLSQLTKIRGSANTFLLKSQIRDVYFDGSTRADKRALRKGILYLVAETDAVDQSFKENLKWLIKLRVEGYRITFVRLLHRPRFSKP